MTTLPMPVLGSIASVTIDTQNFEDSISFYTNIGFAVVARAEWPFPWVQVSDGVLLIMLRKGVKPNIALSWYTSQFSTVIEKLHHAGIFPTYTSPAADVVKRYIFQSPDGVEVRVVGITDGFHRPSGKGMLHLPQEDFYNPAMYHNKKLGMWGELAIPVANLAHSIGFWQQIGFRTMSQFTTPYPWAVLTDGLMVIGLHETKQFDHAAITYFATDMKERITELKDNKALEFSENAAGTMLKTPEQQQIFLFSLQQPAIISNDYIKSINRIILETERLLLKEVNPEILTQLFRYGSDAAIKEFLGITDNEELIKERHNYEAGLATFRITFRNFVIHDKQSGKHIGKIGFHTWYPAHSRAEIGYDISDVSYREKGYMTEAMQAILHHGFTDMGLNRVEALIGMANTPSIKLVTKYGFVKEGLLRQHYCKNGITEDSIMFALLAGEYRSRYLNDTQVT
jgi:ribosomal-protein-alanine N-acetyltransferase